MCGINAIVIKGKDPGDKPILDMNQSIQHRGPDSSGFKKILCNQYVLYFGADRLRIIDQNPASDQPFCLNGHCLLFNGEIYNHHELRNQLTRRGIDFITSSDTETLLHWLLIYGEDGLDQLKGMFAFVFYNSDNQSILAARDRHGMKPLYLYEENELLIISSEIRGILAAKIAPKDFNNAQINHYLNYRYPQTPETFYKGILVLKQGEFLKYDIGNTDSRRDTYVAFNVEENQTIAKKDFIDQTDELFIDALIRQTRASVPVGLLLSGGVDSTFLLAMAAKHNIINLHTYSIVNNEEERQFGTEDYHYSRKAAIQYNSDHNELVIDHNLLDGFEAFVNNLDQPVADNGAWMTWLISEKAKEKVGVLLSGAGADEYFGGYNRHMGFYRYLKNYRTIRRITPLAKYIEQFLPAGGNTPYRKKIQLLKKLLSGLNKEPEITYDRFLRLFNNQITFDYHKNWPIFYGKDFVEKNMHNSFTRDRQEYLVSDVLEISDRMSMKQGLELRLPFLDDHIVSLMKTVPSYFIMEYGRKWILKSLLRKYGGREFARRPKEGFGMPIGQWIRLPRYQSLVEKLVDRNRIIFNWVDHEIIMNTFHAHMNKKADYTLEIWAFMVLSAWLENEFS
ncbi:asparagine synthase (glutamine-hydrolyzing) [Bacteroidota bacterium]